MARVRVYTLRVAAGLLLTAWAASAGAQDAPRFTADPAMTKGPAAAPVTVFEWSDYECPFCRRAQDVLQRLQAEFPDTVRFVFKDFPLRSHPNALPAALAARCAGAQGRYWEYHDLLFVAQPVEYAGNPAFRTKLVLASAGIANAVILRRLPHWPRALAGEEIAPALKLLALLSLLIWTGALVAGRWIAFV